MKWTYDDATKTHNAETELVILEVADLNNGKCQVTVATLGKTWGTDVQGSVESAKKAAEQKYIDSLKKALKEAEGKE